MTGFNKLFWGFLLILLDFRIQGFDILPDVLGYILIFHGLGQLMDWNPHYVQARKYVPLIAVLSIFDLYQIQRPIEQVNIDPIFFVFLFIGVIGVILDLFMVYHICLGISDMAANVGDIDLQLKANTRWRFYFYTKIAGVILMFLVLVVPGLMLLVGIPLIILALIVAFLIMFLMKQADHTFQHYLNQ